MLADWFGLIHVFRSNNYINCNNPFLSPNFSSNALDNYIVLRIVMFGFTFIVQNGTSSKCVGHNDFTFKEILSFMSCRHKIFMKPANSMCLKDVND